MGTAVYFDLETGGLEPHHPDIQIAAIAIDEATLRELGTFECKIQFDATGCEAEALAMNSYSPEAWEHAKPACIVVKDFGWWLNKHKSLTMVSKRTSKPYKVAKLVAHNGATFDGPRLKNMFAREEVFLPADPRVRCTMQLAMWHFDWQGKPPASYKLEELCKHFEINTEGAHDALSDVRMCIQLASKLRKGWF